MQVRSGVRMVGAAIAFLLGVGTPGPAAGQDEIRPPDVPLAGSFYGRVGARRERQLREGGGTNASEAAVARGLKWLVRTQTGDGRWKLHPSDFKEIKLENDAAATALALLPFLAVGKTHKPARDNPYNHVVEKGIEFLLRCQDRETGFFAEAHTNTDAYSHGLATIALCEAYGLTKDSRFHRPAQLAADYIIKAQHEQGGWRYRPGQAGDMSVTGWMIVALKSARMAGLNVPATTMHKAQSFLESMCDSTSEGYSYTGGGGTPTITAVGLLCRQHLQWWGPQNIRLNKSIDTYLKKTPPTTKNCYYYYYATQVMYHFGGEAWKVWNEQMREHLVRTQDADQESSTYGSWHPTGDTWEISGGRLMITSLNLLTLEVYYRYLPLYYRETDTEKNATKKNP